MDSSPCSAGTVATVMVCSQPSCDIVMAHVEHPSSLKQSPIRGKAIAIAPACIALATPSQRCGKTKPGTKTGHVDCDASFAVVPKKRIKANVNRDVPPIGSLKLRLLLDRYMVGGCYFHCVAHSLHALASDNPVSSTHHEERVTAVYSGTCDNPNTQSASSLHKELGSETWVPAPKVVCLSVLPAW